MDRQKAGQTDEKTKRWKETHTHAKQTNRRTDKVVRLSDTRPRETLY